ncbi:hypothetical protein [Rhodohalobacter sp. 8-1]|uniref:hypothetical protein n=1 Tax=Rhodohalobacter sp. 8-1 TaxID=3131972 RepID=UPI0030ED79D1
MQNKTVFFSTLLITLLIFIGLACTSDRNSGSQENIESTQIEVEEIPLIYHMSFISRYTQKLYFAGEADNWELADIYRHEIEEISADIVSRGETHDGINISELMESMLLPQIEQLEEAIDSGDREMFMDRYSVMIQSCNNCHDASDYGAVKVKVPDVNPYAQDFSVE